MDELLATFNLCCNALQTGVNILEANNWLTSLMDSTEICYTLMIAFIQNQGNLRNRNENSSTSNNSSSSASTGGDSDYNAVFLAAKIIHNIYRNTNHSVVVTLDTVKVREEKKIGE